MDSASFWGAAPQAMPMQNIGGGQIQPTQVQSPGGIGAGMSALGGIAQKAMMANQQALSQGKPMPYPLFQFGAPAAAQPSMTDGINLQNNPTANNLLMANLLSQPAGEDQ